MLTISFTEKRKALPTEMDVIANLITFLTYYELV